MGLGHDCFRGKFDCLDFNLCSVCAEHSVPYAKLCGFQWFSKHDTNAAKRNSAPCNILLVTNSYYAVFIRVQSY